MCTSLSNYYIHAYIINIHAYIINIHAYIIVTCDTISMHISLGNNYMDN
jgi:hypothetical protein